MPAKRILLDTNAIIQPLVVDALSDLQDSRKKCGVSMFFRNTRKTCSILFAVMCLTLTGCAKITAAAKLGVANDRFKGRTLVSGTTAYDEYYVLQKTAFPHWLEVIDEHGDPDYILPGFGSYCQMVWLHDNLVGRPTIFDTISMETGVPEVVVQAENSRKRVCDEQQQKKVYEIESLTYVDGHKKGILVVQVPDGDFPSARKWALAYIETLVKDKNVALRTDSARQEALYSLRDERIDGKVLTIEFEAM